jgi:hypothetical protein
MSAPGVLAGAAPDLVDPVLGFRLWSVRGDRLYSPFRGAIWEDVELAASCECGAHDLADVPASDCECGVYAYYEQPPRSAAATRDLVAGAVVLWGQMQLHSGGMRASHARIVGLVVPPTNGAKRRQLMAAAAYLEVPAVPFRELKTVASRSGAPMPAALRPPRIPLPWGCPLPSVSPIGNARLGGRSLMSRGPTGSPSMRWQAFRGRSWRAANLRGSLTRSSR